MCNLVLPFLIATLYIGAGAENATFDHLVDLQQKPLLSLKSCQCAEDTYEHGESYDKTCFIYTCIDGEWKYSGINTKCAMCWLNSNPTIQTFDRQLGFYVWEGSCNYTFVQPIDNSTDIPSVHGVLSRFGWGSPLIEVTYKVSDHVVVTIQYGNLHTIQVNGNTKNLTFDVFWDSEYFLLYWRDFSCIYIHGPLEVSVCPGSFWDSSLKVYADESFKNKLVGLCGYYSGDFLDDYILRDGTTESYTPFPKDFPKSWLSLQQPEGTVISDCEKKPFDILPLPFHLG